MPKTKLGAGHQAKADFALMLKARCYAVYGGYSPAAQAAKISPSTMCDRMSDVGRFRVDELIRLRVVLKIPKEDFVAELAKLF